MTYQRYLTRIMCRLTEGSPYICFAITRDWWHIFSPNACRLKREISHMLKRSRAIDVAAGGHGFVLTIGQALYEKYNTFDRSSYHLRMVWLLDLQHKANK